MSELLSYAQDIKEAQMVSGWDRNPGPHNDYASPPQTIGQVVKLATIAFIFYGVIVGLVFWS